MTSVKSNSRSKCTIDDWRDVRLKGPGDKDAGAVDFAVQATVWDILKSCTARAFEARRQTYL